ncbi:hypothetical protein E5S67_06423 [Microcoleus sp. IPMA8]|uniref:Transposase n=1 Tax=Microcoleus asticus IPMA8 TaxID=2563858 RepID=A0ABX2DA20_9CYAN|nr:hypothetical protein [Microcoleus asticus IPMA8]
MKTYSLDFRQKIMEVYHNEPLSQRAIANRFCVALSFVQKIIKQYRETQNIAPRTERCGVKLKRERVSFAMSIYTQLFLRLPIKSFK